MIVSIAQAQLFFLALTRVFAVLVHVPMLGGRQIPNQVKVGLGILLTIVILPWQPLPPEAESIPAFAFALAIGRELLIGTLAGFAATLTFAALQIAGKVMGIGSGFGSGQIINPTLGDSGSAMNNFFLLVATLLFLVVNGHHFFLLGLQRTFEVAPLNSSLPNLSLETLLVMTAALIGAGIQLGLPVLGTVLLTDLTLGLLARVAPQVHVFFLGIPLKIGLGLIVLAMALASLFPVLSDLFHDLGLRTLELLGA